MTKTLPVFSGKISIRQAFTITNLVILVVGTLFTLLILGVALESRREELELRLANRAEVARAEVDLVLRDARNALRSFADDLPAAVRGTRESFRAWIAREGGARLAAQPGLSDVYFGFAGPVARRLFGAPGMVYVYTKDFRQLGQPAFHDPATFVALEHPDAAYLANRDEQWYHGALERQGFYASPLYFDATYLKSVMLSITTAVHELRSNALLGVAGVDVTARSFGQLLAANPIGRTGGVLLVDADGIPLAPFLGAPVPMIGYVAPDPRAETAAFPLRFTDSPRLPVGAGLHEIRGRDGRRYLAQARRLNELPYFVLAYQERAEAFRSLYWTLGAMMALAVGFLAVSLYFRQKLAAFVTESIERILINLQANQRRLESAATAPFRPIDPGGPRGDGRISEQLNGLYGRLHDAFDEIRSEKDRAELATRAKSRFLSVMSHEIRTPLNSMLGLTDVLLLSPLESEQVRHLRVLQRSGQSLLRILNDILDFSRLEAGKLEIEAADFDLYELLYDVESLMRFDAEAKGLWFQVTAPNFNYRLSGDSIRIRQALLNLVGNAIKFTAQGGIDVRVTQLPPRGSELHRFRFEVVDTGIGMTEEQQSRIFSEFAQADASITRRYGGTGLGLAISKQIVGLLGGDLTVRSELERGSTFEFTIPLRVLAQSHAHYPEYAAAAAAQGAPPQPSAKRLKPDTRVRVPETRRDSPPIAAPAPPERRILVVDDDEDNHRLIDAYMGFRKDLRAVHCFSAKDALAELARRDFALVLMDMQMPEMDGLDAVREIRALQRAGRIPPRPVVMISANTFAEDRVKSLEAGADEHVGKPIKLERFKEILARYLE